MKRALENEEIVPCRREKLLLLGLFFTSMSIPEASSLTWKDVTLDAESLLHRLFRQLPQIREDTDGPNSHVFKNPVDESPMTEKDILAVLVKYGGRARIDTNIFTRG